MYSFTDTNLIVDITGRFPTGTGVVPAAPQRLVDTRSAEPRRRATRPVCRCASRSRRSRASATTAAVALDVTAVGAGAPGLRHRLPVRRTGSPRRRTSTTAPAPRPRTSPSSRPGTTGEVCVVASSDVQPARRPLRRVRRDRRAHARRRRCVSFDTRRPAVRAVGRRVDERDRRRRGRHRRRRRRCARQHHRDPSGDRRVPDGVPVRRRPARRVQPQRRGRARRRQLRARRTRPGRPRVRVLQRPPPT